MASADPVKLTWKQVESAPLRFVSDHGTAVVDDNTAYFSYAHHIYSFSLPDNKWTELPQCSYQDFGMTVINSKLTTVGGYGVTKTNILLSLISGCWKEVLPPMPTGRAQPATAMILTFLVVAGGVKDSPSGTDLVEVLNTDTLHWSTARSLPRALSSPQMIHCGRHLYLTHNATAFSCSVEELLKSCKPTSTNNREGCSIWTRLADIPVKDDSSLATLKGHVLTIGGNKAVLGCHPTSAIHSYNGTTNSWSVTECIPTSRYSVLTAVLSSNGVINMVVVGGWNNGLPTNDTFIGSSLLTKSSNSCLIM